MGDVDDRVRAAMRAVDRRGFLPRGQRRLAGSDQAVLIGHGATCSQPSTVETMLTMLAPRPGDRCLDVGAGSGWTTALLAHLVAPGGSVVGVEIEPALVGSARANLVAAGYPDVRVTQADPDRLGLPGEAPFDRILVSAEARELPHELLAQLTDGGLMVVPVRGDLLAVDARGDVLDRHGTYSFVRLRDGARDRARRGRRSGR
ncbi:protein-L-isoaspartate O-methyltransferase [Georgenia sp. M64]|uniref:protein-L-isoaspartate O-methyltransferase family protein n=1 Tax=Georgenia sp. M64 TaxID=3120520 RepID=UPI0030DF38B4